jgi:type II restriction enzyme
MEKGTLMKYTVAHLSDASDLITPYENTRAGFVQMALEKNQRASPFVAEARDLAEKVKQAQAPLDLLTLEGISGALLTAAGISDKASGHLDTTGKTDAVQKFVESYLVPAGTSFREELVYRFLLTRGDSLGGSMRNIVGALAERRFNTMLFARLANSGRATFYKSSTSEKWIDVKETSPLALLEKIQAIAWKSQKGERVFRYNAKIEIVDKNIDMSLLATSMLDFEQATLQDASLFLALGELKGGIDPAGADEHWKTANSALDRIRKNFSAKGYTPQLFFVGAAIEQAMSKEIWHQLQAGSLANAANLTVDSHLTAFCDWLVNL